MKLLSDACEYALRAVVWLAQQPRDYFTVGQIAEATCAAPGYLVKVLQALAKAGILAARRGSQGGFQFTRNAAELTVLEVIRAVDPLQRIEVCPLGKASHDKALCPLHRRIDQAIAAIEQSFAQVTIQDLITETAQTQGVCRALIGGCSPTIGSLEL
jgi:Rrf2 family protein